MTTIRLVTQMYSSTPLGALREGHILSQDGGPVFVVEGRSDIAITPAGHYAIPSGSAVTQFGTLRDAVEYVIRRGWNSSSLTIWAGDMRIPVPVSV